MEKRKRLLKERAELRRRYIIDIAIIVIAVIALILSFTTTCGFLWTLLWAVMLFLLLWLINPLKDRKALKEVEHKLGLRKKSGKK